VHADDPASYFTSGAGTSPDVAISLRFSTETGGTNRICADSGKNAADASDSLMTRPAGPNLRAARKMTRLLRKQDRLEEVSEALLVLLRSSAELADLVSSPGPLNDTPVYARAKVLAGHAAMLGQLAALVGVVQEDSGLDRFLAGLSEPGPGSTDVWLFDDGRL
jgi:hypothetical protein